MWLQTKFFLLLCCVSLSTIGATLEPERIQVYVKVLNGVNMQPVKSANVIFNSRPWGITDTSGLCRLRPHQNRYVSIQARFLDQVSNTFNGRVKNDTMIQLVLWPQLLNDIDILVDKPSTFESGVVENKSAENVTNIGLQPLLKELPGIQIKQKGEQLAKPVIWGLTGNRVGVQQNGHTFESQRWGADHAPEIGANHTSTLKLIDNSELLHQPVGGLVPILDFASLDYANIQPATKVKLGYQTNGHGIGLDLNQSFVGKRTVWQYKVGGNKIGDQHTANYWLNNTGAQQLDIQSGVRVNWNAKIWSEHRVSYNLQEIGVLRGSQIGNLTDLESSFSREEPFFTEADFDYQISAPRQTTQHYFASTTLNYQQNELTKWRLKTSWQTNARKEFEVRRQGRSERPILDLNLNTFHAGLLMNKSLPKSNSLTSGIHYQVKQNLNDRDLGVLPLMPNYNQTNIFPFVSFQTNAKLGTWNYGVRYQFRHLSASQVNRDLPRGNRVVNETKLKHGFTLAADWSAKSKYRHQFKWFVGAGTRLPAPNELYSQGLHQGVSGIELGDADLKNELGVQTHATAVLKVHRSITLLSKISVSSYQNYIFLEPSDELRLTIQGAFPVFNYRQVHASILGVDAGIKYEPIKGLTIRHQGFYLRARQSNGDPLPQMPSTRIDHEVKYESRIKRKAKFKRASIALQADHVFRQTAISEEHDFVAAPEGYFLLHLNSNLQLNLNKATCDFNFGIHNLFNTAYRDYLNTYRYFADDIGINVKVGMLFTFKHN